MTPERKKLIETMAQTLDPDCWDKKRKLSQHFSEVRHRRSVARKRAERALRAAEDKLNVIVVPNKATGDMVGAIWPWERDWESRQSDLDDAIAASPYRREG